MIFYQILIFKNFLIKIIVLYLKKLNLIVLLQNLIIILIKKIPKNPKKSEKNPKKNPKKISKKIKMNNTKLSLNSFFPNLNISNKSNDNITEISLPPMTESKNELYQGVIEQEMNVFALKEGDNNYTIGKNEENLPNITIINSNSMVLNYLNVNDNYVIYSHQDQYRILDINSKNYTAIETYFDDVKYCCLGLLDTHLLAVLHNNGSLSIMNIATNEDKPDLQRIRHYNFVFNDNEFCVYWNPYDAYTILYRHNNKYVLINILDNIEIDDINLLRNVFELNAEGNIQNIIFLSKYMFLIHTNKEFIYVSIDNSYNMSHYEMYIPPENCEAVTGYLYNSVAYTIGYSQKSNIITLFIFDGHECKPFQRVIIDGNRLFNPHCHYIPTLNMILLKGTNSKSVIAIGLNDYIMESLIELILIQPAASVGTTYINDKNILSIIVEYDNMISEANINPSHILLSSHVNHRIFLYFI